MLADDYLSMFDDDPPSSPLFPRAEPDELITINPNYKALALRRDPFGIWKAPGPTAQRPSSPPRSDFHRPTRTNPAPPQMINARRSSALSTPSRGVRFDPVIRESDHHKSTRERITGATSTPYSHCSPRVRTLASRQVSSADRSSPTLAAAVQVSASFYAAPKVCPLRPRSVHAAPAVLASTPTARPSSPSSNLSQLPKKRSRTESTSALAILPPATSSPSPAAKRTKVDSPAVESARATAKSCNPSALDAAQLRLRDEKLAGVVGLLALHNFDVTQVKGITSNLYKHFRRCRRVDEPVTVGWAPWLPPPKPSLPPSRTPTSQEKPSHLDDVSS
ncbi:hypothetical protein CF319_g6979 [Tilletia indica]|nr:hypothetical protein CF319_g6979 [Tilletia indica]